MFFLDKHCQMVFQSGGTNLHSHLSFLLKIGTKSFASEIWSIFVCFLCLPFASPVCILVGLAHEYVCMSLLR